MAALDFLTNIFTGEPAKKVATQNEQLWSITGPRSPRSGLPRRLKTLAGSSLLRRPCGAAGPRFSQFHLRCSFHRSYRGGPYSGFRDLQCLLKMRQAPRTVVTAVGLRN